MCGLKALWNWVSCQAVFTPTVSSTVPPGAFALRGFETACGFSLAGDVGGMLHVPIPSSFTDRSRETLRSTDDLPTAFRPSDLGPRGFTGTHLTTCFVRLDEP